MNGKTLRERRKELGWTQDFLAKKAGISRKTINNYENGSVIPESKVTLINMLFENGNLSDVRQVTSTMDDSAEMILYDERDENIEVLENNFGNKFEKLSNGQYLMYMPLFEWDVAASFLSNDGDVSHPDYAEIAQHTMIVDTPLRGHYVGFRIKGDSMFDGTDRSIKDGDIVAGRELQRIHWTNKLHLTDRRLWIVASTMFGRPTLKEIVEHDVKKAVIICDSWNPSVEYAHNVEVSLNTVTALYYAVDVSRPLNKKLF